MKFGVFAGADFLGAKVANYFFGVRPTEVTQSRTLYQPGISTNGEVGIDGSYKLSPRYAIFFGLQATQLLGVQQTALLLKRNRLRSAGLGLPGISDYLQSRLNRREVFCLAESNTKWRMALLSFPLLHPASGNDRGAFLSAPELVAGIATVVILTAKRWGRCNYP